MSVTYASTLNGALSVTSCEKNFEGEPVLTASPSIRCDAMDSEYLFLAIISILIGVVYFGGSTVGVSCATGEIKRDLMQDHRKTLGVKYVVITNVFKSLGVFSGAFLQRTPLIQLLTMLLSAAAMVIGSRHLRPHDDIADQNEKEPPLVILGGRLPLFCRQLHFVLSFRCILWLFSEMDDEIDHYYATGKSPSNLNSWKHSADSRCRP